MALARPGQLLQPHGPRGRGTRLTGTQPGVTCDLTAPDVPVSSRHTFSVLTYLQGNTMQEKALGEKLLSPCQVNFPKPWRKAAQKPLLLPSWEMNPSAPGRPTLQSHLSGRGVPALRGTYLDTHFVTLVVPRLSNLRAWALFSLLAFANEETEAKSQPSGKARSEI